MLRDVRMTKAELMATVRANLETHLREHREAHDAFVVRYKERLIQMAADADAGKFAQGVNMTEPVSHEQDYARAFAMLNAEQRDVLDVDAQTFQQLVMDDWEWKDVFTTINKRYSEWK